MYVFVLNNGRDDICSCGSRPRAKKGGVGGKVDLLALLAFLLSVISSLLPKRVVLNRYSTVILQGLANVDQLS